MLERSKCKEIESKQVHKEGKGKAGEGEAGSPLSREPDAGLNPRTLGS